jgi:hypothetical protein
MAQKKLDDVTGTAITVAMNSSGESIVFIGAHSAVGARGYGHICRPLTHLQRRWVEVIFRDG